MTSRIPCGSNELLDDDRTEKVGCDLHRFPVAGIFQGIRDPPDVSPQGLPLVFLVPDVGALERRDLVADRPVEQLTWSERFGIHVAPVKRLDLVSILSNQQ